MKLTISRYPDHTKYNSPCWNLTGRYIDIDADWNTRFPFGACVSFRIGRQPAPVRHTPECETDCRCVFPRNRTPGFTLDLNAPLGEPNRLGLLAGRWHITLGLPSVRDFRETSREKLPGRGTVVHGEHFSNWLHPHIDGLDRYRYHKDASGRWVRNDRPEPGHWGWLTIEKRGAS